MPELRAGDFAVDVPRDGAYDPGVFAGPLNTFGRVGEQGPTNVFLRVDGRADSERELYLPLGCKWVVWDHTDTMVRLTEGRHTLTPAARSLDGKHATRGDAIADRLPLLGPSAGARVYEGEPAWLDGGATACPRPAGASGNLRHRSGAAHLAEGRTATSRVYSPTDRGTTLTVTPTEGTPPARTYEGTGTEPA